MIEAIEAVMQHWGEQLNKAGSAGGLPSVMGTIVEYGGCAPRGGVSGAKVLLGGAGIDYVAAEVEAALAVIERGEGGAVLVAMARLRYTLRPAMTVAEQVRGLHLGLAQAGERAYFRLVGELHLLVEAELKARLGRHQALLGDARKGGDRMRLKGRKQAIQAHRARGIELFKGVKA